MVGIIDYGMGNLASVSNALNFLNIKHDIVSNYNKTNRFDKYILPGVGAFGMAMDNLRMNHYDELLSEEVLIKQKPILGICLGMQLLLTNSEEFGFHSGLNIIPGSVRSFKNQVQNLPIPHMGWNDVSIKHSSKLYNDKKSLPCFYFVHSYYCQINDANSVTGVCNYGIPFHAMVEYEHIMGCQFHPEKSQNAGMEIYRSFNAL